MPFIKVYKKSFIRGWGQARRLLSSSRVKDSQHLFNKYLLFIVGSQKLQKKKYFFDHLLFEAARASATAAFLCSSIVSCICRCCLFSCCKCSMVCNNSLTSACQLSSISSKSLSQKEKKKKMTIKNTNEGWKRKCKKAQSHNFK